MNLAFPARWTIHATMLAVLAGCASPPMTLPGPITYSRTPRGDGGTLVESTPGTPTATSTQITAMPTAPIAGPRAPDAAPRAPAPAGGDDEPVSMALEQTPLPLFIQILYGNVLKRPYSMDAAINTRTDLVTFKTSSPIPRSLMAQLGVTLLRGYGLAVQDLEGLIRILPDTNQAVAPPPVLRRGRVLPETPEALRPAFQHVELDIVRSTDVSQWLRQILGNRVNVQEDTIRNGFLLAGTQNDLRTALDLIGALDQPRMRGNVARRISPANMAANDFANRLVEVMSAQGYSIASGAGGGGSTAVLLVPIPAINAVIAFANSDAVMDHLVRWATEIDRPVAVKSQSGLYTYPVKYADAQELARTLGEILGGAPAGSSTPVQGAVQPSGATAGTTTTAAPRTSSGSRVVVNSATNTLIFRGTSADEYQQIMSLMRELDRPVKSALIEVVVAELAKGTTRQLGVTWQAPTQSIDSGKYLVGTSSNLSVGNAGFNLSIGNSAGQLLARLNALAFNKEGRILSNPKILARNGETATIQVGSEVPIITSQQSTGTSNNGLFGSTTGVLQQITYRSTGVILRVRPVINSGNRLDLDLSQEVSAAQQTDTGVSSSPTISTRRIETKLSLRDGSTVLLGGLISRNQSGSNTGVPILKDIPGIGSLFRTEANANDETELLIMITPYVVSDDFESESISEAIQNSFGDWAKDIKRARVVPQPEIIAVPPPRPREAVTPAPATPNPLPALTGATGAAPARPDQPPAAATPAPAVPGSPGGASPTADKASTPEGVTMSRPEAAKPPAAPASAPKAADAAPSPPKPAPPGNLPPGSREVNDPKVKEEILKLLEKKR